jgi:hypothetical protein
MSRPTRNRQRGAAAANRLFVSASTLAFVALMGAVIVALQLGRI